MPYIKQEDRDNINPFGDTPAAPSTAGELNYVITEHCKNFLRGPAYADYNEVIGVLESVKLEFYRRAVAPYEDKKKEENGDVY